MNGQYQARLARGRRAWGLWVVWGLSWSLSACSEEVPSLQAQLTEIGPAAEAALKTHCLKWSEEQIRQYAQALVQALQDSLQAPLPLERWQVLRDSLEPLAETWEQCRFEGLEWQLYLEDVRWRVREFLHRPLTSPEEQAAIDAQVDQVAQRFREVLIQKFPERQELADRVVERFRREAKKESRNGLFPGLKRALSSQVLNSVLESIAPAVAEECQFVAEVLSKMDPVEADRHWEQILALLPGRFFWAPVYTERRNIPESMKKLIDQVGQQKINELQERQQAWEQKMQSQSIAGIYQWDELGKDQLLLLVGQLLGLLHLLNGNLLPSN